MRTLPGALQTELNGVTSTPVRLVKITRKNGTVVRFAESRADLTVDAQSWPAAHGVRVSSIVYELNETTSTVDVEVSVVDGASLDPDDIRNGLFDSAELILYAASHGTPANGLVELWRGYFGQTELTDRGLATIQAVGLLSKARDIPIEHYSPVCRADFGDARCKLNVASFTTSTTITNISGFNVTVAATPPAAARLGLLKPTTGNGVGEGFEIRSVSGNVLKMYIPPRGKLTIGDAVDIIQGCDHTLDGAQGCKFYSNVVNFRGEPHIPGADAMNVTYSTWGA